jgi:large subunit ribosomal protein L30
MVKHTKQAHQPKYLAVTLIKSRYGRLPKHRATLLGLGLRKIRQTVRLEDTPCVRGMIHQVSYLLKVEQC